MSSSSSSPSSSAVSTSFPASSSIGIYNAALTSFLTSLKSSQVANNAATRQLADGFNSIDISTKSVAQVAKEYQTLKVMLNEVEKEEGDKR